MNSATQPQLPSERKFAALFTCVLLAFAGRGYFVGWQPVASLGCALGGVVVGLMGLVAPTLLRPLNRAWFLLGEGLGKIVSPIVLGALFFLVLTPLSQISRLFGRDELRLKRRATSSYWIERNPAGPPPESYKNQF